MSISLTGRGITLFDADSRGGDADCAISTTLGAVELTIGDSGVVSDGVADTNKLAHIEFDEGTGTSAVDISGNGYTGTLANGATWAEGRIGQTAVSLDGSNDKVTFAGALGTAITGAAFTVSAWVRPSALSDQAIVFSVFSTTSLRVELGLSTASLGSNNDVLCSISNGSPITANTNANIIATNTWHLWTMVYDGSLVGNARLKFYLDGVAQTLTHSATPPATLPTLTGIVPTIGARNNDTLRFGGRVDDARLYLRALTAAEVAKLAAYQTLQFHGTVDELDALFRGDTTGDLVYTSPSTGNVTFTISVTDEDDLMSTVSFAGVVGAFDAPVIVVPGGTLTPTKDVNFTLDGLGFDVSDSDDTGEYATLVLEITAGGGTITASPGDSGVTVVSDNGTAEVTLTGTIDSISDFLTGAGSATFSYLGTTTGAKTIELRVTDSQGQTGTNTKAMTVRSAPVVSAPASYLSMTTSANLNIHGTGFSYTDTDDSGTQFAELTASAGTITVVAGTSGVTSIVGSGTSVVTFQGTKAQINALLQSAGGAAGTIVYTHNVSTTTTLTVEITDNDGLIDDNFVTIILAAAVEWTGYAVGTPLGTDVNIPGFPVPIDLSRLPSTWWDKVSADGRDIRVTLTDDTTLLPRDLLHFDKTSQKGILFAKITQDPAPPTIHIWVGATSAAAPTAGEADGQYATYDSFIQAWWPDGGGDDRTNNLNHLDEQNGAEFGTAESEFGVATSYLGSKYATTTVDVDTSLPETFCAFMNPADRTHETVMCATRGTITNICRLQSSKVTARTILSDALGATIVQRTATAVGDVSRGAWQFVAASFLSEAQRIAYREGGNPGTNTVSQTGAGGTNLYAVGATVKDPSSVVADHFRGSIGLAYILTDLDAAKIPAWIANYSQAFDQAAYWGTWTFVADTQTGL